MLPESYYLLPYWQREWVRLGAAFLLVQVGASILLLLWQAHPPLPRAASVVCAALAVGMVALGVYCLLISPAAA